MCKTEIWGIFELAKQTTVLSQKCIAFLGSEYGLEEWDNQERKAGLGEEKWGDMG